MEQMMKVAMNLAQAMKHGESLEQVKQRFAVWRESRKRGEHITGALWDAAARMVEQHGLQRTAEELRIDCNRLSKRLDRSTRSNYPSKEEVRFVEMFASPAFGAMHACECIVEMENARGGKMRVELKSLDGLTSLSSGFWSAR
jgi:hypothetical protein